MHLKSVRITHDTLEVEFEQPHADAAGEAPSHHIDFAALPTMATQISLPRFVKADGEGNELPAEIREWPCVLDRQTRLLYTARTLATDVTWAKAKEIAEAYAAGLPDSGWRLPTVRELLALVDYERCNPAINADLFPETKSSAYWSSSAAAYAPESGAWVVYFNNGGAYWCYRDDHACVRAVRAVGVPPSQ